MNRDISRYIDRAKAGNRWFRKYCDIQRAPRCFFTTDILTLCHNNGGGVGGVKGDPPPPVTVWRGLELLANHQFQVNASLSPYNVCSRSTIHPCDQAITEGGTPRGKKKFV